MTYTTTRHKHGIIFTGTGIPIVDMCALVDTYRHEFDLADTKISTHLEAIMVLTTRKKSIIWRNELGIGGEK